MAASSAPYGDREPLGICRMQESRTNTKMYSRDQAGKERTKFGRERNGRQG
jgi:hypothetical protein